jgi:PEGA domain
MRYLALLIFVVMLAACSMPVTKVSTVDSRPTISFENAPSGAEVYLDGVKVGFADQFNANPDVLNIESGTHQLVIKKNGQVIFEQRFFADSEHKSFKLR